MAAIVYLDPEDEITSAAARIRQAPDTRIGLVLPFGSRVATSRINFRLLAREAQANGRRLDIVAPDSSARALAASAGLAVFASVGEYEDALDVAEAAGPALASAAPTAPTAPAAPAATRRPTTPAPASSTQTATVRTPGPAPVPTPPAGAVGGFAPTPRSVASPVADSGRAAELDAIVHRSREAPVRRPAKGGGGGVVVGVVILVFAVVVALVSGFLFLPTATITLAPRIDTVGPVAVTVRADPEAQGVDQAAGVIPAHQAQIPLVASADFPATGKRVEKTPATGGVRWSNCDPTASYTIPKGTLVKTGDGVAFAIDEQVFLPVAIITGNGSHVNLTCQTSEVAITAVESGLAGNVGAGTITVVPARYNRTVVRVTNPNATDGGTETTYTKISKKDVDGALASLQAELDAQLATALEDPSAITPGLTAFPETVAMGEPQPSVDPDSLVNQEVPSFTLTLTATATMLAVDPAPIEGIAAARLSAAVKDGATLVQGSTTIKVGEGSVMDDGSVTFSATATAREVPPVDADVLRQQLPGLTADEVHALLDPYGTVTVELWPGFVSTVPGIAQRFTFTVLDPVEATP